MGSGSSNSSFGIAADNFKTVFGTTRGSKTERTNKFPVGTITLTVAPHRWPGLPFSKRSRFRSSFQRAATFKAQNFKAVIIRKGDAYEDESVDGGVETKTWNASPVIAFYLPGENGQFEHAIRYIGTATFMKYHGNGEYFGVTGANKESHYLDTKAVEEVCDWLTFQFDADELTTMTIGKGDHVIC